MSLQDDIIILRDVSQLQNIVLINLNKRINTIEKILQMPEMITVTIPEDAQELLRTME